MKLMTKTIEQKFQRIGSQDGKGMEAKVIVKYFNPIGAGTWLITEGTKLDNGDWELFGYCHITDWEWGYVLLSQLESIVLPLGLRIERDLYISDNATVGELANI